MKDQHRFDSVIVSKIDHFYTLKLAVDSLNRYTNVDKIYIVTQLENLPKVDKMANNIIPLDENKLIPFTTIKELKNLGIPGFPDGAGWYFQQLLKLGCAYQEGIKERYLVWDADTVLLRPLEFYDNDKMICTIGSEYHAPYLVNFRKVVGVEARREYSFIAQHMPMTKTLVREMLARIESNCSGQSSWAWKIMHHLSGSSRQLFSEYEWMGNYLKIFHPDRLVTRRIPWTRYGSRLTSLNPTPKDLQKLAKRYFFASFETWDNSSRWRKFLSRLGVGRMH